MFAWPGLSLCEFDGGLELRPPEITAASRGECARYCGSNNPVSRLLDAFPFATRATARPGKAFSLVKYIPARKTSGGNYDQPARLRDNRTCYVGEVAIDLFFLDAQHLGEVPGAKDFLGQQLYHLPSNGLHSYWRGISYTKAKGPVKIMRLIVQRIMADIKTTKIALPLVRR